MSRNIVHIVIVESSFILYQGLKKALDVSDVYSEITCVDDLNGAEKVLRKMPNSVIIVNPAIAQFNSKDFHYLRKNYTDSYWVAFAYQLFDEQLLAQFDALISINDDPDKISEIIRTLLHSEEQMNSGVNNEKLLSEREIEVLKQLALGLSSKEIADKLNISPNTAITHRKNITQKTGIKTVSGLTIYAVVNKYIMLDSTL